MKAEEFYKKWYFKTQGIECGEPLSNELVIIKFAEEFAAEQIKELTAEKQHILNAMARGEQLSYELNWDGKSEKDQDKQRIKELKEEMEEYGRLAFYRGREIDTYTKYGEPIFKRPTYNGYLRELNKH
jgi:hypothetical protein